MIFFSDCRNKRLQCYYQWKRFLWSISKHDLTTYDSIKKLETGQGDDYTTGCLHNYPYFQQYFKLIATDLSKQQRL